MGIPVSLILIAVGAILTWGVNADSSTINIGVVGVVLMVIGLAGLVLTLLFWQSWWGGRSFRRTAYADDYGGGAPRSGYRNGRGRRRTVVEEEEAASPADPPL